MMTQYGFFFDQSRCYACQACSVACKDWNEISPGPEKWMTVYEWETGCFPDVRIRTLAFSCGHCENPLCLTACPNGAIFKEEKYGAVLVDRSKCQGCRTCYDACPYGAPKFADDAPGTKMSKCTMCVDRIDQGKQPMCAISCPIRAFDFGPIEELRAKYGELDALEGMPSGAEVRPSYVFKPGADKIKLFPYDSQKAIELNRLRGDLTPLFDEADEVVPGFDEGSVPGRSRLVMKHESQDDLLRATRNDIG